jgi:hypothetical protein
MLRPYMALFSGWRHVDQPVQPYFIPLFFT